MLIIDTHAHLFSQDETAFPPVKNPSRPPAGSGTFERLLAEVERHEITGVTAVQVSGFYGFDNRYVCSVARENPHWIAAICTLDPTDERSPRLLADYARNSNARGLRSIPAPGGKLDHPGVRALWRTAANEGIPVNVQGRYPLEEQLARLLRDFPALPVALDHSFGLASGGPNTRTLAALARLSKHPNLNVKLSFIANGDEGCRDGFPCRGFHETVLRVIDMFGPERCAWGSHFPTEKYARALSYGRHLDIYRQELALSEEARRWILGKTARRLWFPEIEAV